MRILIFELCSSGHRLQYVRAMLDSFRHLSTDIILAASANVVSTVEYGVHLSSVEYSFTLDTSTCFSSAGAMKTSFKSFLNFYRIVKKYNPDYIYVPFADGLSQFMGMARLVGISPLNSDMRLEMLIMRGRIPYEQTGLLNRLKTYGWLKATECSGADAIHFLNPLQFSAIKNQKSKLAKKARIIPEPVEKMEIMSRSEAREQLGIPTEGRYIVCLGRLDLRKGIDLLLRAYANASLAVNDRLLLLGKVTSEIKDILNVELDYLIKNNKVIIIDRYVSQEELGAGICAADVVCTPYPAHLTSSGFVVRAAALGRPVLTSNVGWMGEIVPKFDLGKTCNVTDSEIFSLSISESLNESGSFVVSERGKRFIKFHTLSNFSAHWLSGIYGCLGLPADVKHTTWDWVISMDDAQ